MDGTDLPARLAELEERVARLEQRDVQQTSRTGADPEVFWALNGLRERLEPDAGAVLFAGAAPLPTGEYYEWQQAATVGGLLDLDWAECSAAFNALGHPVRLLLLREVLGGARTGAELKEHEALGTTGQLYHHIRQLVAAGWLQAAGRGRYVVPGARVVPLLVLLAAVNPPAT
ncbi:hypothetical protein [Amycolatopsis nigrescens]|uniref:hypothetical protein n=1 Tax=Amycolatopsis nigrescens TaxID=381445 RepID=UPI00037A662D|nr:hypothetical protein [Amycolatopsis nigrescens]